MAGQRKLARFSGEAIMECEVGVRNRLQLFFTAGMLVILFAIPILAQLPTGTILGVVKDSSGAVVPNATVTIRGVETGQTRTAVTSNDGQYRAPALSVGHYDIKVEQAGFSTQTQTGLNLEVAQEAVVNFTLQVGTAQQQI